LFSNVWLPHRLGFRVNPIYMQYLYIVYAQEVPPLGQHCRDGARVRTMGGASCLAMYGFRTGSGSGLTRSTCSIYILYMLRRYHPSASIAEMEREFARWEARVV